jgi:hypothetical protein
MGFDPLIHVGARSTIDERPAIGKVAPDGTVFTKTVRRKLVQN